MDSEVASDFSENRIRAMGYLQEESSLEEIVRLVGRDSLSQEDQLKLEVTKSIREDFLQQNAFHETDTYCSLEKQSKMLRAILEFYDSGLVALEKGAYISEIEDMPIREKIARAKNVPEDDLSSLDQLVEDIKGAMNDLVKVGEANA
ncbi:MAG: hypothetical protein GX985_07515 [Gallicola sp.]|nr:hypothetical protein [Gallicola sp.]